MINMYLYDERGRYKQERELIRDRQHIMKALTNMYGVKTFNFEADGKTFRARGKQEQVYITARLVGVKKPIGLTTGVDYYQDVIGYTFKPLFGRGKKHVNLQVLGYGEVSYLMDYEPNYTTDNRTNLYVHLRGENILEVHYPVSPDIRKFSLYCQQAIKDDNLQGFINSLKKDLNFYEKL